MPELIHPIHICYEIQTNADYVSCGSQRTEEQHCIFHYCLEGHGRVRYLDRCYDVRPGHGFLCVINNPEMDYFYPPEETEPWRFYWISYLGGMARELTRAMIERHGPVFPLAPNSVQLRIFEEAGAEEATLCELEAYDAAGVVDNLLFALGQNSIGTGDGNENQLVTQVKQWLRKTPASLNVNILADRLGVSREHLSRVYRKETGRNLKAVIDECKCSCACQFLFNPHMSLNEIAAKVGFANLSNFSRMFKHHMHMSPAEYRIYQRRKFF